MPTCEFLSTLPTKSACWTIERLRQFALQKGIPILDAILNGQAISVLDTRARLAIKGFADLVNEIKAQMEVLTLPQLIQKVVEVTGYAEHIIRTEGQLVAQERLENLAQLISAVERQFAETPASQSLHRFLDQLALLSPQDEANWQSDAVTLITAHSAKGLEFPVVFVVGLEEGLFPHSRSLDDAFQLEEERRLFYVALTRAKDRAFLTYAQRRGWLTGKWGEARYAPTEPSRFLNEVPTSLLDEWRGVPTPQGFLRMKEPDLTATVKPDVRELVKGISVRKASELVERKRQVGEVKSRLTLQDIRVGMKVRHKQFGIGVIVAVEPDENLPMITVKFDDRSVGEKKLALDFAPLEPAP